MCALPRRFVADGPPLDQWLTMPRRDQLRTMITGMEIPRPRNRQTPSDHNPALRYAPDRAAQWRVAGGLVCAAPGVARRDPDVHRLRWRQGRPADACGDGLPAGLQQLPGRFSRRGRARAAATRRWACARPRMSPPPSPMRARPGRGNRSCSGVSMGSAAILRAVAVEERAAGRADPGGHLRLSADDRAAPLMRLGCRARPLPSC